MPTCPWISVLIGLALKHPANPRTKQPSEPTRDRPWKQITHVGDFLMNGAPEFEAVEVVCSARPIPRQTLDPAG